MYDTVKYKTMLKYDTIFNIQNSDCPQIIKEARHGWDLSRFQY